MKERVDRLGRRRHPNSAAGRKGIATLDGDGGKGLKVPAFLGPEGKREWRALKASLAARGILDSADEKSLGLWAAAWEEYMAARKIVLKKGFSVEVLSSIGEPIEKVNPAVSAMQDAWKRLKSMIGEFGIAPASRAKLKPGKGETKDPLAEFLSS